MAEPKCGAPHLDIPEQTGAPIRGTGLWVIDAAIQLRTAGRDLTHTATPLNPGEIADLTAMPKTHNTRTALIVTGVTVGAAAVGAILLHHAFENDKNSMQQQQDAFCLAHGIPLSECAGG